MRHLELRLPVTSIRPLLTQDIKIRRVSGRNQISSDGKHLLDGLAYGRPLLRRPANRPPIDIPPLKRRRITYEEEEVDEDEDFKAITQAEDEDSEEKSEDETNSNGDRQLVLHADFDDDDSEDDEDFQPGEEEEEEGSVGSLDEEGYGNSIRILRAKLNSDPLGPKTRRRVTKPRMSLKLSQRLQMRPKSRKTPKNQVFLAYPLTDEV